MYHSIAVSETNHLYTWGKGEHGTLGTGGTQYQLSPKMNEEIVTQLKNNINILKIDSADDYTSILMSDGSVLVFGKND